MVGNRPGGAGDRSERSRPQGRSHSRGSRKQLYCCFNDLLLCNKPPQNLITHHNHLFFFCNVRWFPLGGFPAPCGVHWEKNAPRGDGLLLSRLTSQLGRLKSWDPAEHPSLRVASPRCWLGFLTALWSRDIGLCLRQMTWKGKARKAISSLKALAPNCLTQIPSQCSRAQSKFQGQPHSRQGQGFTF